MRRAYFAFGLGLGLGTFTRLGFAQPAAPTPMTATAPTSVTPVASPPAPLPAPSGVPATAAPVPAPIAPTTAALAPPPGPARAPAPAPASPRTVISPGEAIVHVAVDYRDAWLETRSYVDGGPFQRTCRAPCDLKLQVQGLEARVTAPGMTTSNHFGFDSGTGTAGVRVEGGSESARRWGIISLGAGIPLALAGMAMFALGRVNDNSGLEIGGIAALAAGGVSVSISLPLLFKGSTHVKDAKGGLIALSAPTPTTF